MSLAARWFLDCVATHILAGVTSHLAQISSRLLDWLVVLSEGDSHWNFFDGNYQEYEAGKRKRLGDTNHLATVVWLLSGMARREA